MNKRFNKVSGIAGEALAVNYLKKRKYKILEQNYTTKIGEIDIICQFQGVVVFVEVKSRETLAFGRPSQAVNAHKRAKIRRVAEEYLIRNHMSETQVRFDVIEVIGDEINHIENCF